MSETQSSEAPGLEVPSAERRGAERSTAERRHVGLDELTRFLSETLSRPSASNGLESLVMPLTAPLDAVSLLGALRGVDAWYLKRSASLAREPGRELLGLGSVRRFVGKGKSRFVDVERATRSWLEEANVVRHPAAPITPVRAFVGFAFAPGSAAHEPWEPFGDALAVLPRWALAMGPDGASTLQLNLDRRSNDASRIDVLIAELSEIFGARRGRSAPPSTELTVDHEPALRHEKRVEAVLSEIGRGVLQKVVVARRSVVFSDRDLDPTLALERVLARDGEGTVYFVRRGGSVLLGVTPERLLSLRGVSLETEALAGTARDGQHAALLASDKDREEQRLVVRSIEDSLGPLSSQLRVASAPDVASAGSVVHLRTRITATLRPEVSALEVAAALHPTAAVAGTPRQAAIDWIARTEERGWYAGPIGWVDQKGDAELFVALRGGVIRGAQAWAFSGGGIVRGSVPKAELDETVLKMGGFLRALGLP